MPVITADEAATFDLHGSTFTSYAAPSRGSSQLCAWQLDVAAEQTGVAHQVSHEEIIRLLTGALRTTIDGTATWLRPGDVAVVPAGGTLQVDGGPDGASAWVVTSHGLHATTADGTRISPPWTQ
jgi:quercetin dioxygenase-like cupin family protein